jgi:uncharacterized protein YkwD
MTARTGRPLATLLVVSVLAGSAPGSAARADTYRDRRRMYAVTNDARERHDVRAVDLDRQMSDLARRHSLRMAREGTLFHTKDPANYYLDGVHWSSWGENVGVTGGTVSDLQSAFMGSKPHRRNILGRSFRRVAIGAVRVDGVLWVTVFFYG